MHTHQTRPIHLQPNITVETPRSRMNRIASEICAQAGLTLDDIRYLCRDPLYVHARQHLYAALREAGYSYPRIGKFLCRDHKTVMHGIRAHNLRIANKAVN